MNARTYSTFVLVPAALLAFSSVALTLRPFELVTLRRTRS